MLQKLGMSKLLGGTCADWSENACNLIVMLNMERCFTGEILGAWAKTLPYRFVIHHMVHRTVVAVNPDLLTNK
jgi:hypothetical protein